MNGNHSQDDKTALLDAAGRLAGKIGRMNQDPEIIVDILRLMITQAVTSGVSVDDLAQACTLHGHGKETTRCRLAKITRAIRIRRDQDIAIHRGEEAIDTLLAA
jgi:hypothetical protein